MSEGQTRTEVLGRIPQATQNFSALRRGGRRKTGEALISIAGAGLAFLAPMGPPGQTAPRLPTRRRLAGCVVAILLGSSAHAWAAVIVRADPPSSLVSVADRLHAAVVEVRRPLGGTGPLLATYGTATLLDGGFAVTTIQAVGTIRFALGTVVRRDVVLAGEGLPPAAGQVIASFPEFGLAVLRVEGAAGVIVPTEVEPPAVGEPLIVMGSGDDAVTAMGVKVSAVSGDLFALASVKMVDSRFWGGPLLDASGRLVGICLPSLAEPTAVSATPLKLLLQRVSEP